MKKIKNQNNFLFACISCIAVLLTICYFSVDFTLKGTYSAKACPAGTSAYSTQLFNKSICVADNASILSTASGSTCVITYPTDEADILTLSNKGYDYYGSITLSGGVPGTQYYKELTSSNFVDNLCIFEEVTVSDTYAIYFNPMGGTGFPHSTVNPKMGVDYTIPTQVPTISNKVFSHWNTAMDGTGTKYEAGKSYRIDKEIILYAQYTDLKYTIGYDGNGGTVNTFLEEKTHDVDYVITSEIPKRSGYVFKNWNTKADGTGTSYASGAKYTNNADLLLFAIWEKEVNIINSYVKLLTEKSEVYTGSPIYANVATTNSSAPISYFYYTDSSCSKGKETNIASSTSSYAGAPTDVGIYSVKAYVPASGSYSEAESACVKHTITAKTLTVVWDNVTSFIYNGKEQAPSVSVSTGINNETMVVTRTTAKNVGTHTSTASCSSVTGGRASCSNYKLTNVSKQFTIKEAEVNTYTITYDANGGTGAPSAQTRKHGGAAIFIQMNEPTRTGYTFKNWNTNKDGSGVTYVGNTPYDKNENLTLYAQWTIDQYSVTYDSNGGSGAPSGQTKNYGVTLTLSSTKPTRTGYTFKSWNTNKDGSGTSYNPSGTYSGNANLKLYAQWSLNEYSITYNANGGSSAPSKQIKSYGTNISLSTSKPTRSGYTFIGWNTREDGSGTSYSPGETYTKNSALTLYAQWKAEEVAPSTETFKATFDANSGVLSGNGLLTCSTTSGSCVVNGLPTASKDGYTFTGWGTSSTCTSGEKSSLTLTKNTTYKACYTKNPVVETPSEDEDGNTNQNPTTGEIAIALTWFVGLIAIGYSFYYFKSVKQN